MLKRFGLLGTWIAAIAMASSATAADIAHGEVVAQRWCAACHLVATGQKQSVADAPPFAIIAKTRTGARLIQFLANPYPRMPNMSLSRDEIADLVGYIKTFGLAPGEKPPPDPVQPDTLDRASRG